MATVVDSGQVYKLPAERLYATYFGGDEKQGLPADEEAKAIWLRFLPAERVLPFGCKVRPTCNSSYLFPLCVPDACCCMFAGGVDALPCILTPTANLHQVRLAQHSYACGSS